MQFQRHIADLVQEQGPLMRVLETSHAGLNCSCERAFDVAEQLGFQQVLGKGAAINRDHRLAGPGTGQVKRASCHFLARARFAANQHRAAATADQPDGLNHRLHRTAFPHQQAAPWLGICRALHRPLPSPALLHRAFQAIAQRFQGVPVSQAMVCAGADQPHCLRGAHFGIPEDHWKHRIHCVHQFQCIHRAAIGRLAADQDAVKLFSRKRFGRLRQIVNGRHVKTRQNPAPFVFIGDGIRDPQQFLRTCMLYASTGSRILVSF